MEAGPARSRHCGCPNSVESSGSQPEAVTESDLRFAATKGTEDAKKLGQSAISDTRAAVGEPGSYEAIAEVFGV